MIYYFVGLVFSKTESNLVLRDKLSPGTKPGFLKSEKMLRFILFYTHKVYQEMYVSIILFLMDDVIPLY